MYNNLNELAGKYNLLLNIITHIYTRNLNKYKLIDGCMLNR